MKQKKKQEKKRFEVGANETIDQCLERIKKEGYVPIRRTEEPIFQEKLENGETKLEPVDRRVLFDAIKE